MSFRKWFWTSAYRLTFMVIGAGVWVTRVIVRAINGVSYAAGFLHGAVQNLWRSGD